MPKLTKGLNPGDADKTIITSVKRIIPLAERTPACLLDPLHWATRPSDRNRGAMPVWEFEHRSANRRRVFKKLVADIEAQCDGEWDDQEWHTDEAFHPFWIPADQVERAIALIPDHGFSHASGISKKHGFVEGGEYLDFDHWDGQVPMAKLMITDAVVSKLRPKGYNWRTIRGANADGVPLVLLDPHYWDTDPDDYVVNGYVGDEYAYRLEHRRIEFTRLLSDLDDRFDLSEDEYDWHIDESWHAYFIPQSQVADAHKMIADRGFDYEASENVYGDNDDETNLWVQDPVVAALMPEGYNCYTLRSERRRP